MFLLWLLEYFKFLPNVLLNTTIIPPHPQFTASETWWTLSLVIIEEAIHTWVTHLKKKTDFFQVSQLYTVFKNVHGKNIMMKILCMDFKIFSFKIPFKKDLFIYLNISVTERKNSERELSETHRDLFHLLFYFPDDHSSLGQTRSKSRSKSFRVSRMGGRSLHTFLGMGIEPYLTK